MAMAFAGEYRVIFNNCYDCRGATEYFIGRQGNGSKFHIEYAAVPAAAAVAATRAPQMPSLISLLLCYCGSQI
jgi:hypothetical protein